MRGGWFMPDEKVTKVSKVPLPQDKARNRSNVEVSPSQVVTPRKIASQVITSVDANGATTTRTREYGSAGRYSAVDGQGRLGEDIAYRDRIRNIREAARGGGAASKVAGLFSDGNLGYANIGDSGNIGYMGFEFPVDALELPASRPEELRYYRIAYDRDPVVNSAINLHTELPMSKMTLEKPKCTSEEFADFVFDFYQGMVNDTKMFQTLIDAVREYWTIGEAFLFVEEPEEKVEVCEEAQKALSKNKRGGTSNDPMKESQNAELGGESHGMDWLTPALHQSSESMKKDILKIKKAGISFNPKENLTLVDAQIYKFQKRLLASAQSLADFMAKHHLKFDKQGKIIANGSSNTLELIHKMAAPPAEPVDAEAAGAQSGEANEEMSDDAPGANGQDEDGNPEAGGEGAPMGGGGAEGVMGDDGGPIPSGGGGGGGGGVSADEVGGSPAMAIGQSVARQRELMELKHYLKLLKKKKELLEELKEVSKQRGEELELFSHVVNPDYLGVDRIRTLPPEQIEVKNDGEMEGDGPSIYYKPPEQQKQQYTEDINVPQSVKDGLQATGAINLNQDPFEGSYVIHFARKKSGYELHGRSSLQPVLRTILYRDKLRQAQTMIASRNMTPKRLIIAPECPTSELAALRAHVDEAIADPDYTIVVNYDCQWNEIGSEGRLLSLDGEWAHTNSDLAIGLGLSPEILIGEGLYSGNRIQLEILNTRYVQFRDLISGLIEDQIFKPIAMKKGFYEVDKFGRPRWVYPHVTFSRMALRDSGDLYDMLYNLYAKSSIPVSIILDFLNIDAETCKRQLEEDLFTVNDAKFSELLGSLYGSITDVIIKKTDIWKRLAKGMGLDEVEEADDANLEGSGEGM
jgi:hypothetical protein